jgi:hypothetical protein
MQSISAACLSIEQAACCGLRVCVCKTHKRNAIHFGGIAVRAEAPAPYVPQMGPRPARILRQHSPDSISAPVVCELGQ